MEEQQFSSSSDHWVAELLPGVSPPCPVDPVYVMSPAPDMDNELAQSTNEPRDYSDAVIDSVSRPLPSYTGKTPLPESSVHSEFGRRKRRKVVIEEPSQFRDIARYIDSGYDEDGNPVAIDLSCVICGRLLELPDHVSLTKFAGADVEPLVVTPCGHLLGAHCLEIYNRYRDEESRRGLDRERPLHSPSCRQCPICRFRFLYPGCRCRLPLRAYDPRLPRAEQLPLTLLEGGSLDAFCRTCDGREIQTFVRTFVHVLLPDIDDAALTCADPCVQGHDQVREARSWLKHVILGARLWRDAAILRW